MMMYAIVTSCFYGIINGNKDLECAESILPKKKKEKKMQSSYNLVRFSANYLFSSMLKIVIINQVWNIQRRKKKNRIKN